MDWIAIIGNHKSEISDLIFEGINLHQAKPDILDINNNFGFCFIRPKEYLPLTSWSYYNDKKFICFIEGCFYNNFFSHRIAEGEDTDLAKLFLDRFVLSNFETIRELNGSFCGFVFDSNSKKLISFTDRLGTKCIYFYQKKGITVLAPNLFLFKRLISLDFDKNGIYQFITIGFPLDDRTLLRDVKMQLPATINIFSEGTYHSKHYLALIRSENMKLSDASVAICQSVEAHLKRIYNNDQKIALGLTGGHDSRVIFGSLVYSKIPFAAISWRDYNFNDKVVRKLCGLYNTNLIWIKDYEYSDFEEIREKIFYLSDGLHLYSHGFIRLAKTCSESGINLLILGFSGDCISGSSPILNIYNLKSIEELAMAILEDQMNLFSFKDAQIILNAESHIIEDTLNEWIKSFQRFSFLKNLIDIAIMQRLANRNLKRILFAIKPSLYYTQTIYPYLDTQVFDTYMSLPVKYIINQRAHCLASFQRINKLGNFRACSYPIPIRIEAYAPNILRFMRSIKNNIDKVKKLMINSVRPAMSVRQYTSINISDSTVVNLKYLKELILRGKISVPTLHKIHTLLKFVEIFAP